MRRNAARRGIAPWVTLGVALLVGCQVGCLSFVHPVGPPLPDEVQDVAQVPQPCKNKVHVFFLHGLDPNDLANLIGLEEYTRSLGFIKTWFGLPYHSFYFERELRKVHQADPEARFVLVGFSYGAGLMRDLACSLQDEGIGIDLLVYLDGVQFEDRPLNKPANVLKVLNILSFPRIAEREIPDAETHRYDDSFHYGTVTHPRTIRLLAAELAVVAKRVPIVQIAPAGDAGIENTGLRKMLVPPTVWIRDDWDFLQADGFAVGVPAAKPVPLASGYVPEERE